MASRTPLRNIEPHLLDLEGLKLVVDWDDVTCPICLDFPHDSVLLCCSSYDKGCRPFLCDTGHTHSNCLDRFRAAYGAPSDAKVAAGIMNSDSGNVQRAIPQNIDGHPTCPLCRGEVTGWVVINEARFHLNMKERCCEEKQCTYIGNYLELQKHTKIKHPHACPSEVDPASRLDWENFQQSAELVDVLSIIHSEVPRGVVLGDYVIEYADEDSGDEYDNFPANKGSWWTSCITCQVFDNFRASRNRRRSRAREARRGDVHLSPSSSNARSPSHRSSIASPSDDATGPSVETTNYSFSGADYEFLGRFAGAATFRANNEFRGRHGQHAISRSRFEDHL